jgi:hypothetical protein
MTPEERQALREKHRPQNHLEGDTCLKDWSCDVLQVIDVLDAIAMETTHFLVEPISMAPSRLQAIIEILDGIHDPQ